MDDATVEELEAAIADVGILLVRLEKYRAGAGAEALALRRRALDLGDRARRLHHLAALDAAAAQALLGDVRALLATLRATLASVWHSAPYRAAVAAHAASDASALVKLLPGIFAGLEPYVPSGDLFYAVPWRRRGRPRPAQELAAEVATLRAEGLAPEGDDLAQGVDPAMPAVALDPKVPDDEIVVLRLPRTAIPDATFQRVQGGEVLVYCPRLRAPMAVRLREELDADALEDAGGLDYAPYRAAVWAALAAAGIPVDD